MARGVRTALVWRRSLWIRRAPGTRLGPVLLALPLAFPVPLESYGVLGSRPQAISAMIWTAALFLALSIRSGAGLRDPAHIWLYQKGHDTGESALEDWLLDAGFMTAFGLWWALAGTGVLFLTRPVTILNFLSFWLLGISVMVLAHAVSFALSACGVQRPGDLVALFAFLSVLLPGLTMEAPARVAALLDWGLPPFHPTMALSGAVRAGDFREAGGALLQVLGYSALSLGLGYWRISRWRPRP